MMISLLRMILLNPSPVFHTRISASAAKELNPVDDAPDVSEKA
jgi:hypothetical protein